MVRHFCQFLSPERVYRELAHIVSSTEDLTFAALIVQMLNIILLTASELEPLRVKLKRCDGFVVENHALFGHYYLCTGSCFLVNGIQRD